MLISRGVFGFGILCSLVWSEKLLAVLSPYYFLVQLVSQDNAFFGELIDGKREIMAFAK